MADGLLAGTQISTVQGAITEVFTINAKSASGTIGQSNVNMQYPSITLQATPLYRARIALSEISFYETVNAPQDRTPSFYLAIAGVSFYSVGNAGTFNTWVTYGPIEKIVDDLDSIISVNCEFGWNSGAATYMTVQVTAFTISVTYYPI